MFRKPRAKNEYHGMDTDEKLKWNKNEMEKKNENKMVYDRMNDDDKWNKIGTNKLRKMEQKEKLKEINGYLDDMMCMAKTMGKEIEIQDKMINEVQDEMEDLDIKFINKNRKMKRIGNK